MTVVVFFAAGWAWSWAYHHFHFGLWQTLVLFVVLTPVIFLRIRHDRRKERQP